MNVLLFFVGVIVGYFAASLIVSGKIQDLERDVAFLRRQINTLKGKDEEWKQ